MQKPNEVMMATERDHQLVTRLRRTGRRAPAEIIWAHQETVAVAPGEPEVAAHALVTWSLGLRVEADEGETFETVLIVRLPQEGAVEIGGSMMVLFDPDDHLSVVVDPGPLDEVEAITSSLASGYPHAGHVLDARRAAELLKGGGVSRREPGSSPSTEPDSDRPSGSA